MSAIPGSTATSTRTTTGKPAQSCPRDGFAPAFWTDASPEEVEEAAILRIIDGDTFEMKLDGVSNRVRIYRADTPQTQNEQHCGGVEATAFTEFCRVVQRRRGWHHLPRAR